MSMLDGVYKKHKDINGGFFFNVEMSMHKQIFFKMLNLILKNPSKFLYMMILRQLEWIPK